MLGKVRQNGSLSFQETNIPHTESRLFGAVFGARE